MPSASRALVALAVLASTAVLVPGPAAAEHGGVEIRIFTGDRTQLLYSWTAELPVGTYARFGVATEGYNDPGSGEGRVAIDDLLTATQSLDFSSPPAIGESTTGSGHDALRYDAVNQRLVAIGNSGYGCSSNYETVAIAPTQTARFLVKRTTAATGDGSFWNLYLGLVPSDAEPVVGATCAATLPTGYVDNLVGVQVSGDGDGNRATLRGFADGLYDPATLPQLVNVDYLVEIGIVPAGNAPRDLVATNGATSIALAWTAPALGGPFVSYNVYSAAGSGGPWTLAGSSTTTSYTDAGLPPDTRRWYRVTGHDGATETGPSHVASARTFGLPDAPGSLGVLASATGTLSVTWAPPSDDGGSPVVSYRVYRADGAGDLHVLHATVAAPATRLDDAGLPNGATRHYQVSAVNAVGEGPRAGPASGTTFDAPSAPRDLAASAGPGAGEIRLTWNPPASNGGRVLSSYLVHRAESANGPYLLLATTTGNAQAYTDVGLADGVTFHYRVAAKNSVGEGPAAAPVSATSFRAPDAPAAVGARAGPNAGQITLAWNAPVSDGGTPRTGYRVYRSDSPTGPWSLVGELGPTGTTWTDGALGNGRALSYRITATNLVGESAAAGPATATTFALPGAPQGVDARPGSSVGHVRVAWSVPASDGGAPILHYRIWRATGGGPAQVVATAAGPAGGEVTIAGHQPAKAYTFWVSAVNLVGEGPRSASDCSAAFPWPLASSSDPLLACPPT